MAGSNNTTSQIRPTAVQEPYEADPADPALRAVRESKGLRAIGFGVAWLISGVLVTVVTCARCAQATGGGVYGIHRITIGTRLLNKSRS